MSCLVSVLYKQNLFLLLIAVSLGVCGERDDCPGMQIQIKGEIAGRKKKGGGGLGKGNSSKQKGEVVC